MGGGAYKSIFDVYLHVSVHCTDVPSIEEEGVEKEGEAEGDETEKEKSKEEDEEKYERPIITHIPLLPPR